MLSRQRHRMIAMDKKHTLTLITLIAIVVCIWFIYPTPSPTCLDEDPSEGTPVITSLSTSSGSIGDTIEIRGCNFLGFEGDRTAWIENEAGTKGILYGSQDSTDKLIKITLKTPLCQKDTSYSGLPCDSEFKLVPGKYLLYTLPWGRKSNTVPFIVK